jgi:hypothetical protein
MRRGVADSLGVFGLSLPPALTHDDVAATADDVIDALGPLRSLLADALVEALAERMARIAATDAAAQRAAARERLSRERAARADC